MRLQAQSFGIERLGGLDREQGAKDGAEILLCVRQSHRLGESPEGDVEELLDDLEADDSFLRCDGLADQLGGLLGFRGSGLVERVDEDVRVKKEPIAH